MISLTLGSYPRALSRYTPTNIRMQEKCPQGRRQIVLAQGWQRMASLLLFTRTSSFDHCNILITKPVIHSVQDWGKWRVKIENAIITFYISPLDPLWTSPASLKSPPINMFDIIQQCGSWQTDPHFRQLKFLNNMRRWCMLKCSPVCLHVGRGEKKLCECVCACRLLH